MPWIIPYFISNPTQDKVGEKICECKEFDVFLCFMKKERYEYVRYKKENDIGNSGRYVIFFHNEKDRNSKKEMAFKISDIIASLLAVYEYTEFLQIKCCYEMPYPVYLPKHYIKDYVFLGKKLRKYHKCEEDVSFINNISGMILNKYLRNIIFSALVLEKILSNENLFRSLCFFTVSSKEIFFYDDMLEDIVRNRHETPGSICERFTLENYFFNAYKAIEALIGDPNKNRKKFENKLLKMGINPNEKVGFGNDKNTVIDEIYRLNKIRDTKVGHGSMRKDYLTYYELARVQYLSRYLIRNVLNNIL